jgi:hypothetical protein
MKEVPKFENFISLGRVSVHKYLYEICDDNGLCIQ